MASKKNNKFIFEVKQIKGGINKGKYKYVCTTPDGRTIDSSKNLKKTYSRKRDIKRGVKRSFNMVDNNIYMRSKKYEVVFTE